MRKRKRKGRGRKRQNENKEELEEDVKMEEGNKESWRRGGRLRGG